MQHAKLFIKHLPFVYSPVLETSCENLEGSSLGGRALAEEQEQGGGPALSVRGLPGRQGGKKTQH